MIFNSHLNEINYTVIEKGYSRIDHHVNINSQIIGNK